MVSKSTEKLQRIVSCSDSKALLPEDFLIAVRRALDVGLDCPQISAIIMLATTVAELKGCFEGRGLQERVEQVITAMRGFPRIRSEVDPEGWFEPEEE